MFFKARIETVNQSRKVAEAVPQFLASKEKQKKILSVRYLKDLKNRLMKFSKTFGGEVVAAITSKDIDEWLQSLEVSGVTHDNYHRILSVFFEWAQKEGVADTNPIDQLRDPEPVTKTPGVFTPEEAARLLENSSDELLPYLALIVGNHAACCRG